MPGIVVFSRRWSVGSDDLILPSFVFLLIHSAWLVILTYLFVSVDNRDWRYPCMTDLYEHILGYIIILAGCIITELCICFVSSRGTIMETQPRQSMKYLIYVRLGIFIIEICWLIIGVFWLYNNYDTCDHGRAKDVIFTFTICNSVLIFIVIMIGWCAFDRAGRSWVKMKRYQNSLKESQCKFKYKRSGSTHRNWRHRKAVRKYQDSWNKRCQMLFCCLGNSDRNQNSFAEVAKILSEFFRDLDVVPSDVIAGLIIVRKAQKQQRELVVNSFNNDIVQYLSGVPITSRSKFLDLNQPEVEEELNTLIYYLDYAIAVYGWPMMFMFNKTTACCKLCPYLKCSECCINKELHLFDCCFRKKKRNMKKDSISSDGEKIFIGQDDRPMISGDNCLKCNYAALNRLLRTKNYDLVYTSYHVEINEPPFVVILDHDRKTLVISVRGTLSLQDIITDLNAEGEILPLNPTKESYMAHKGMLEAAVYIQNELTKNKIIERALNFNLEKNTQSYTIVLVGHSLGAGVSTILSILLKPFYPDLVCYSFAPPGGLLSYELVEHSKSFITSVVLGKDIVPRLGLRQLESLRYDLIHSIKENEDPKYKIISSMLCCYSNSKSDLLLNMDSTSIGEISNYNDLVNNGADDNMPVSTSCSTSFTQRSERELSSHPVDSSIALSVHKPLYPGGKIIHIVRTHPSKEEAVENNSAHHSKWSKIVKKRDVVFKALYVDNTDFNEILISPVMIQDHMPNRIMDSLQKLFANHDSQKVQRCKTISSGSYSNLSSRFRDHYSNNDLAARPLLSYQYSSNWSNDTLDRNLTTIAVQPSRQHQYEYPEMDFKRTPSKRKEDQQKLSQYREKKKQIKKGSINEIIRKMKKIDLASDEWVGKAPLATPETLSETSSICSKTTNELILNSNTSTNNKRNSLETVTESGALKAKQTDSVTIDIEEKDNDNLKKVDVTLDIDVNALFDKLESDSPGANSFNLDRSVLDTFEDRTKDQLNSQLSPSKFVKRTSSLKRNDSTSSSSKRVTFDTKTVLNTGETVLLNKSFCRRSNSERINRHKLFTSSNNKSQKQKQRHENQLKDQLIKNKLKDLIKEPIKDRDQVDNELNEKLEELLGQSLSCSDTDLSKIGCRSNEEINPNSQTIKVHVHNEQLSSTASAINSRSVQQHYSPIKQQIDSSMDYSLGYVLSNMNLPESQTATKSNESSPKKSVITYQNFKDEEELDVNELYNKEQYERLFAKLSTIESPSIEELDSTCDNKFKSDLNKINE